MVLVQVALSIVGVAAIALIAWRVLRHSPGLGGDPAVTAVPVPALPPEGLLVSEDVLLQAGSTPVAIWKALEAAAVPVALEHYRVSASDVAKYRAVPINAAAQKAMVRIVEAINPKGPTLFRAVLPAGKDLVNAVGTEGFRGFSRTGGETVHAVLKPVAAGGAIAAGWPVFAVAATVMAVDMVAQRELRVHQAHVESVLNRQEERYVIERIAGQRSADTQLTRAINQMLDGHDPRLELALKSAGDEFHRVQSFLQKYAGVVDKLIDDDGRVDRVKLEAALGGRTKDVGYFIEELRLARVAVALQEKALIADGAAHALVDPRNPYTALRSFLDLQAHEVIQANAAISELTHQLLAVELKGRRLDTKTKVAVRQELLREQVAPLIPVEAPEVLYLVTESKEIVQLLPLEDGDQALLPPDEPGVD